MNSVNNNTNIIYFFLTLSSLNSIGNKKLDHPITLQILSKYHYLFTHSYNIIFCWLPSHVGITGNEKADKAAKSALNKPIYIQLYFYFSNSYSIYRSQTYYQQNIFITSGSKRGTHKHKILSNLSNYTFLLHSI